MNLPKSGHVDCFAIIVDINHFSRMVKESEGNLIAQFVRDVLYGSIQVLESNGGEVVGFMGDAFLGLIEDADSLFLTCVGIAENIDKQCEWISENQEEDSSSWWFSPGGPSLSIAVEYGRMDVSTISSKLLGQQFLFVGDAINYAARIGSDGEGNRCHLGPEAARRIQETGYELLGGYKAIGKSHEEPFDYFVLDLSDIWREGEQAPGEDTFWG